MDVSIQSETLYQRTVRHISEYLEKDMSHLQPGTPLNAAGPGLDSLRLYEMMLYLEDCFGVSFEESALAKLTTVQSLVDLIRSTSTSRPDGAASAGAPAASTTEE